MKSIKKPKALCMLDPGQRLSTANVYCTGKTRSLRICIEFPHEDVQITWTMPPLERLWHRYLR